MVNTMIKSAAKLVYKIIRLQRPKNGRQSQETFEWERDAAMGITRRKYHSYQHYLDHQSSKLSTVGEPIRQHDQLYERIVKQRYAQMDDFQGKRVICLGARLGGEVRAFKALGALAIGIDIEPGPQNSDVLYGDFHDLRFPNGSFDVAFANVIDHVFDLNRFLDEVSRVLSPDGIFYVELGRGKVGQYEVLDMQESEPFLKVLGSRFRIESKEDIKNTTNYVDWEGLLLKLSKTGSHEPRSSA